MNGIQLKPIGFAETQYQTVKDCPASAWDSPSLAKVIVKDEYASGLAGIKTGDRLFVLWWLDRASREVLTSTNSEGNPNVGVFAMRTPSRPNPIGLTVVVVVSVNRTELTVQGLECVSGSKILDIKGCVYTQNGEWI